MIVIVCGGRNFKDRDFIFKTLDLWHARNRITHVVHGAAKGADTIAGEWAITRGIPVTSVRAEWEVYGRKAGPIRNTKMLIDHRPQWVIAFPGGDGTGNMIEQALAAGVRVWGDGL